MKFKKLVSALTLGTLLSTVALGTASCLDASKQEQIDQDFLDGYEIEELEQKKARIQFDGDSVNLMPGATCEIPIISEEGNIIYDYASSDRDIAVVVEKDGKGIVVAGEKEGEATITVRGSNNKIGYFKVYVSNVVAPSEDEYQTGAASNISDTDLANSLPDEIRLNGSAFVKKVTIIEGQSVIINPTLYPSAANGLWKIYWQYDRLNGDDPNYPSNPGYFYYNITDDSTKSSLGKTEEDQASGFWKDGQKMGYRVEVFGVKAREAGQPLRKLVCETVGGLRKEIEVEVIADGGSTSKASIVYPQISIIGNKGDNVETTGTSSTYITAIGYPNDEGLTYKAESLNPSVFKVSDGDSFNSGGMVTITPVSTGTGYIRVTMGRSTAIAKVVVKEQYIESFGNMQFTVTAKKDVKGADHGGAQEQYPKERVCPDGVETHVFGTYFPTNASIGAFLVDDKPVSDLYFLTDVHATGSRAGDVVRNENNEVYLFKGGYFRTKEFKMERRFQKVGSNEKSNTAQRGCQFYVGPGIVKDSKDETARMNAAKGLGKTTFVMPFAVHNTDDKEDNPAVNSDVFKDDNALSSEAKSADTSKDPSPVYLLVNNTDQDLVKDSAATGYIQVADSVFIRRDSLMTRYKASDDASWTEIPTMLASGGDAYTLPTKWTDPWYPGNGDVKKEDKGDKIITTVTNYTFKEWVKYDVAGKKTGDTITSISHDSGKIVIAIANFEKKETKTEQSKYDYDEDPNAPKPSEGSGN